MIPTDESAASFVLVTGVALNELLYMSVGGSGGVKVIAIIDVSTLLAVTVEVTVTLVLSSLPTEATLEVVLLLVVIKTGDVNIALTVILVLLMLFTEADGEVAIVKAIELDIVVALSAVRVDIPNEVVVVVVETVLWVSTILVLMVSVILVSDINLVVILLDNNVAGHKIFTSTVVIIDIEIPSTIKVDKEI